MPGARPYVFNAAAHAHLIPYLAALQGQCITQDRMIGTFLPPLNHDKLLVWWREKIAEANAGTRTIFILLEESDPGSKAKGNELVGAVMLGMPKSETSPFRAHVESLLIHTRYRKRGGARQLMAVLHTEASQKGKTLLLADAESGSAGEEVLKKLGYTAAGKIPNYSLSPSGELKDVVFLYKDLPA